MLRNSSYILLLAREGLIGGHNIKLYLLTEELIKCFILTTSLSLFKREIRESSINPFTNFGKDAVDKLFTEEDVHELVELTRKLIA